MPSVAPKLPGALRALIETGGALVRRSSSGRVALARAAPLVDPEALPRALSGLPGRLEAARAEACVPLARKDAERVLGRLGLRSFDPAPLAVTPTAQVHRGERDDGTAVAVKLQRPGLVAAVRSDLALLDTLAAPLRQVFGAVDAGAVLRELREAALDELDLEHEASTQRQARRALRGVDGVVVPVPDLDLGSEEVLVCELLDGPTLADAEVDPGEAGAVARRLLAAHVATARAGLALTDARPGHVVLLGGGRIGLLGTGVARPVDRARVEAVLAAFGALRAGDEDGFVQAVAGRLELLPPDGARRGFALAVEVLDGLLDGPATLDAAALRGLAERALERLDDALALAAQVTPQPSDVSAARALGQLAALLARLRATEDWGALVLGT